MQRIWSSARVLSLLPEIPPVIHRATTRGTVDARRCGGVEAALIERRSWNGKGARGCARGTAGAEVHRLDDRSSGDGGDAADGEDRLPVAESNEPRCRSVNPPGDLTFGRDLGFEVIGLEVGRAICRRVRAAADHQALRVGEQGSAGKATAMGQRPLGGRSGPDDQLDRRLAGGRAGKRTTQDGNTALGNRLKRRKRAPGDHASGRSEASREWIVPFDAVHDLGHLRRIAELEAGNAARKNDRAVECDLETGGKSCFRRLRESAAELVRTAQLNGDLVASRAVVERCGYADRTILRAGAGRIEGIERQDVSSSVLQRAEACERPICRADRPRDHEVTGLLVDDAYP